MPSRRPPLPRFTRRPRRRRARAGGRRAAPRLLGRLLLAGLKLGLLAALSGLLGLLLLYYLYGRDLPDPQRIGQHRSFETTRIYARDGATLLYELVGPQDGTRTPVALDRIPQILKDATVAVEDAGFYTNPGVDFVGIARAAWQNYQSGAVVSGASTITMQLVRGILLPPEEAGSQSYERKLREALLAIRVSQEYSKDQILSIYLNEVYYGAQAYGVEAAAQRYFAKHVWELTPGEATLIAGLPQSPTTYNLFESLPVARARQAVTLGLMVEAGYLSAAEAAAIAAEPIELVAPRVDLVAPHFVFYVRDLLERRYGPDLLYRAGLRVITTLDPAWQAQAQQVAAEQVAALRERNASNAAVVMLDPDGQILAMVGSVDYNAPDGQVNVALALRQPGSALKPFIYAAALQRGWTPATVIWDVPTAWQLPGGGVYEPGNYDGRFRGPVRLRLALANSLNIPAVKALEHIGVPTFVELMSRLGVGSFTDPSRYGLAMALGSNEVRLLDLAGAYGGLRAGGRAVAPTAILRVTNSRGELLERWAPTRGPQLLGAQGEQIAYLISDILSDNEARALVFGRGSVMELPDIIAAVKTGTSNDYRDSWALGYSSAVTVGVWVGNNDSAPMAEVAGANGAGAIWRELMLRYHAGRPAAPLAQPAGIVEQAICADTGGPAEPGCPRTVGERFVAGSGPASAAVGAQTVRVGGDGSCLAASYTPPAEVREVSFPVYPPEVAEWAARNLPQPPRDYCPPPRTPAEALALLGPLGASDTITATQVFVGGIARGPFTLEVGAGGAPSSWQLIGQNNLSVESGLLGVWSTAGLAPGEYTLRLRVTLPDGVTVSDSRTVRYAPPP